jgi:hypothetical protein
VVAVLVAVAWNPSPFASTRWTPEVEDKVAGLVQAAVS